MRQALQHLVDAAIDFADIGPQHHPAETTIQQDEQRRDDGRRAIAHELLPKSMNYSDERNGDDVIFDEERAAQTRAGTHEHRRNKISDEWIREAHAGERGIFRWKILAVSEARNNTQMKRQVSKIIEDPGRDSICIFQQRAAKDQPHRNRKPRIKEKVDKVPSVRPRAGAADRLQRVIVFAVNSVSIGFARKEKERPRSY